MKQALAFKKDRFRKNRGGSSRWLVLHCEKCKRPILLYQKDGPGILKRLYLDRIVAPKGMMKIQKQNLTCKKCRTVLGVPMVYAKEKRPAFRLFAGAIGKKIVKGENMGKFDFV